MKNKLKKVLGKNIFCLKNNLKKKNYLMKKKFGKKFWQKKNQVKKKKNFGWKKILHKK